MEDFESGTPKPRRYRNRRLGDFLKELDLTEGKSTGITTVRAKLKSNGSPAAIYEFDEERTYFSATVKIHPEFLLPSTSGKDDSQNDSQNDSQTNAIKDVVSMLSTRRQKVLSIIDGDRQISVAEIGKKLRVSPATVNRDIKAINDVVKVYWSGSAKSGRWKIESI